MIEDGYSAVGCLPCIDCDDGNHALLSEMMENLEISKMSISIGATSINRGDCELFYSGELGERIVPNISVLATTPSTITLEYLSKIWSIDKDLAEKAIYQNTHLYRRSAENDL